MEVFKDDFRCITMDQRNANGGAAGLYEGLGFKLAGEIPDYALKPHGGLSGTLIYWKRIGGKPA